MSSGFKTLIITNLFGAFGFGILSAFYMSGWMLLAALVFFVAAGLMYWQMKVAQRKFPNS